MQNPSNYCRDCRCGLNRGGGCYLGHHKSTEDAFKSTAEVSSPPTIESLPGAGNPSDAYVKTQNIQNAQQASEARKGGTSFVPTITRPSFLGSEDQFEQDQPSAPTTDLKKRNCPIKEVVYMYKPNPASCTVDNLKLARSAGVAAKELVCQSCSCPALRLTGYTAGELKEVGYSAAELRRCGFTIAQLQAAGFSAKDLKAATFTAA